MIGVDGKMFGLSESPMLDYECDTTKGLCEFTIHGEDAQSGPDIATEWAHTPDEALEQAIINSAGTTFTPERVEITL